MPAVAIDRHLHRGEQVRAAASAALGSGDSVASVTIDSAGSGYTAVPAVTFGAAPSGGATAAGTAVRQSGVASVTITNQGSGTTATGTAVMDGIVSSVTITNPGNGYTAAPTVAFNGGGGTGAAATATVQGSVTSVTIADRGRGYVTAPTVTFTGGGGTGATATARLTRGGNSPQENLFWARHSLYGKQLIVKIVDE